MPAQGIQERLILPVLGVLLGAYTLLEVNYARLSPQSQLALFALLGLVICFLHFPVTRGGGKRSSPWWPDAAAALAVLACFGYLVVQTEPLFRSLWLGGQSLGNRAGHETTADFLVGLLGLLLVLEAARRSIGWTLPLLSLAFLLYGYWGPWLPEWMLPHRGYSIERLVSQTFLQSQGVLGVALRVMFTYVFLFVLLGAFLKATGSTQFVVDFARRFFRGSPGGPAKVAVLSSGLMGSLSGSAVANTATTGTFTIPMMRASGFRPTTAAGIEAAASSGGALVPPVMGAGAYMMLEIVTPPVTYLQIIQAALLPAVLYYLSLFLIVHFHSRRLEALDPNRDTAAPLADGTPPGGVYFPFEGILFLTAFTVLIVLLLMGYTPFRAVSVSILAVYLLSQINGRTRVTPSRLLEAFRGAARDCVPLIAAAACVGIVIGIVTLTGVGSRIPSVILPLAEGSLTLALVVIMVSTIILGMGLPSAVCYLLMATLIGPVLSDLGVVPLGAHLFIFYFGMMSMVTPPVALAAYAAASIAGTRIMETAVTAFRFALVGFTLPYMFVFRPELLMLTPASERAPLGDVVPALVVASMGIVCFAAGIARQLFHPVGGVMRIGFFAAAALLLFPSRRFLAGDLPLAVHDLAGAILLAALAFLNWKQMSRARTPVAEGTPEAAKGGSQGAKG